MSDIVIVLRGAIDSLSYHCVALLRVMLIPVIVLLTLEYEVLPNATGRVWVRAITFFYLSVHAFCMLSMFRILINGANSVPQWGVYTVSKSSIYFILYTVCLFIVLSAISYFIFSSFPSPINWGIFFIAKTCLLARIILVFPAISVNSYFSFTTSWRKTKNHQFVMLLVACVVVLLREVTKFLSNEFLLEGIFLGLILEITVWVVIVSILSEAFKLVQMKNNMKLHYSSNSIIG